MCAVKAFDSNLIYYFKILINYQFDLIRARLAGASQQASALLMDGVAVVVGGWMSLLQLVAYAVLVRGRSVVSAP